MAEQICSLDECWVGTVVVGERGQVVIPAEARKKLGIGTGDTLFAVSHPSGEGLMLFKIGAMREFLNRLAAGLSLVEEASLNKKGKGSVKSRSRRQSDRE